VTDGWSLYFLDGLDFTLVEVGRENFSLSNCLLRLFVKESANEKYLVKDEIAATSSWYILLLMS
jgi:hypothetical protein